MPSGNPGKFSTIVVVVSKPPGCLPLKTSGFKLARAVYKAAVIPAQPEPIITTRSIEPRNLGARHCIGKMGLPEQGISGVCRFQRPERGLSVRSNAERLSALN